MSITPLQPIAGLLIRRVFKWVMLAIIAFSSLQAWLNYRAIEKNFDMTINDVVQTHLPLLSLAIWDIEPQAIQKQIGLLVKNSPIIYAHIRASTGQQFEGGRRELRSNGQILQFDIPAQTEGTAALGVLELVIDRSRLREELLRNFIVVFIEVLVLAIFILIALVAVLRQDLQRPMRQLADFVKNLQANQISTPLALDLPPGHAYNEIDLVIDGFRTMQESIQKHISQQDQLVLQRTEQLENAMSTLEKLSITDGLTACYNRLLFNQRMPTEMQRATRYVRELSVLFCDIDFFKRVNDSYGHAVGDKVLVSFANCIKDNLRSDSDWVVRYGGEEFVVVLPETSLIAAVEVAERMRAAVEQALVVPLADGTMLQITASFGVAQKKPIDTLENFMQRADQALYVAKNHGRNRVQAADGRVTLREIRDRAS
ncbi:MULTISPECIES: diguanylate cyclase [unclassified Undibacterium]|uniref:GGDEF domain-containing protein n=1 Tax=unclassified Undibacterium TaxID=2630295 RepID=UPI002AC96506|nr:MULTISPECIES: diguanylate cyclase [unclassified Undibacterium]MEB0139584.1 diguanylate cyclase [Undibacterium sp. CCC2.1]MEB0172485.1 diguanylate cyclase [Undibacterium sp. CCC1.1]MEB0176503.1 diguanylate cyclase [Undibacterium sp. CCC3.4]MEB0215643.1 diguanylate cyclase [Undibacterium sp. 5I2]WPX43960.1 diguanylate cyclase [Undibacterium sp. CCC3.4]